VQGKAAVSSIGDFVARPVSSRIVVLSELINAIENDPSSLFIVDARAPSEFAGSTQYNTRAPEPFLWMLHQVNIPRSDGF
jgi:3-mercaptopyruvate sulfurtransferase SseA